MFVPARVHGLCHCSLKSHAGHLWFSNTKSVEEVSIGVMRNSWMGSLPALGTIWIQALICLLRVSCSFLLLKGWLYFLSLFLASFSHSKGFPSSGWWWWWLINFIVSLDSRSFPGYYHARRGCVGCWLCRCSLTPRVAQLWFSNSKSMEEISIGAMHNSWMGSLPSLETIWIQELIFLLNVSCLFLVLKGLELFSFSISGWITHSGGFSGLVSLDTVGDNFLVSLDSHSFPGYYCANRGCVGCQPC